MGVLEGLEPVPVFHFFEEICKIPRGSFHTEKISNPQNKMPHTIFLCKNRKHHDYSSSQHTGK